MAVIEETMKLPLGLDSMPSRSAGHAHYADQDHDDFDYEPQDDSYITEFV